LPAAPAASRPARRCPFGTHPGRPRSLARRPLARPCCWNQGLQPRSCGKRTPDFGGTRQGRRRYSRARLRKSNQPVAVSNTATTRNTVGDNAGAALRSRHRPRLPGSVQDWAGAVQGALQHTPPGAQNVEAHCVPLVHGSPKASGVGVGVTVGVDVGVGVAVDVAVEVTVGIHGQLGSVFDSTWPLTSRHVAQE